jgi:predicted ATPase/DNA-binding SARP family transcriptional activator
MERPAPVRLNLFGPPTIEQHGAVLPLPFERRGQLCVLLALRGGWVTRTEVASMLWPEQEARLAFTNLRKTLFRMPALAWAPAIEAQQAAALRLEIASDVADFEAALREQRSDAALALYRGELLAGFDDGQSEPWTRWVGFERDRLRTAWRTAALARLADETFDAADAVALASRLLESDPLDEAALRALMQAQRRAGQAGAALQAWRAFVDRLQRELGLEPGAQLRALHDAVGLTAVPPARSAAVAADDGFVGRSVECQRIASLLARGECRLLCLVGPGGVGKTRLARRTMALLEPQFADAALFVELEDATTPAQFGGALAQAAGVGRGRGEDALARAIDALRGLEVLLVLDNFEQLAEHAALLERLLQEVPRLKLLVTSRTRLAVAGEWSMPVEGLPWPEPEDEDRAEAFDAVRLFVKAAQRVEPAFTATAEQQAIVDICRQVEGLPLAIELAAAWVRVLSCAAIAAELRQGSELLQARDAAHPQRHASIEQVFEQSWQRLVAVEREALARLSVFRGGFTAEAARAVARASLPVLGALIDKSLLRKDENRRLQLHPLVQQMAAARLGARDDHAATLDAHADHMLRWVAQLKPALEDGAREALLLVDREFDNCRAAWLHAAARGQVQAQRSAARALLNYCDYRGRSEEWLGLLRQALASEGMDAMTGALLLSQVSHLEYRLDRYAEAQADAERALAAVAGLNDADTQMQALLVLGSCALQTGHLEEARKQYKRALALASPASRAHNTAAVVGNLALVEKRLGHYEEALRLHIESLAQHRRIDDSAGVALCLNNLGTMYLLLHEYDAAAVHLRECLALSERDGLLAIQGYALSNLADVALFQGDLEAATRFGERGLELARSTGNRGTVCWLELHRARVALRRGELERAREALALAIGIAAQVGVPSLKSGALLCFAELLEAQGHADAARRVLAFAVEHPATLPADRDQLRAEWAKRAAAFPADPPWPGLALDELIDRIVAERDSAHAALVAALGGAQ